MTVVDASVLVAAFRPGEPGHDAARRWYVASVQGGGGISSPVTLLPEVGAAIARVTGDQLLATRTLSGLVASRTVSLEPLTEALADRAAELAIRHALKGCDAIYVALAESLGENLVTLDEEQLTRGAAVVTTLRPS